jgi:two-component system LytT family sensor kinase
MRSDIDVADTMLKQLGSLLRITLRRSNLQLIPLRDEVEFVEMYLAVQDRRYGSRVQQTVTIDLAMHDAIVPAMISLPLVESAYVYGLSKLGSLGRLTIEEQRNGKRMMLSASNSGVGLQNANVRPSAEQGVGLANTRSRPALHYGTDYNFLIRHIKLNCVRAVSSIPLQLSENRERQITGFSQ